MSFINLTPDKTPDGSTLFNPGLTYGLRYFYFTFKPTETSVSLFLSRNRYRNEEYITKVFTYSSSTSILTPANVTNIVLPTTFSNGFIGLSTPNNYIYANNSTTPNCKIVNLTVGTTYIIESRTIYNDIGIDFGLILRSGLLSLPIQYIQTAPTSIQPIPPPSPPPNGTIPTVPTRFTATVIQVGVFLSWNSVANASEYEIYREGFLLATVILPMHTDSYVISGTTYTYSVLAANSNGESPLSQPISVVPSVQFINMMPDSRPNGVLVTGLITRYFYHTFTAITPSIDVFLSSNVNQREEVIIGLFNVLSPTVNLLTNTNISNLDTNVSFGTHIIGLSIESTITVVGIRVVANGLYANTTSLPNFRINNLTVDLSLPSAVINTYILEIVSIKNDMDVLVGDLGMVCKNVSNDLHNGYSTQIVFNSVTTVRTTPMPYVISYNFTSTSLQNYSSYIFPYLYIFQTVNNMLGSIILTTPNARPSGSMIDMTVLFSINSLDTGILGQSSITKWKVDNSRRPDFPYEQAITFNNSYLINGYLTSVAKINGNQTINGRAIITYLNTLLHEMIHGLGFIYASNYNTTTNDIGFSSYLTNVSESNPWYKGPPMDVSMALEMYKLYCKNNSLQRIPIENNYGTGTILTHWDEGDTSTATTEKRYFNSIYHPALKYELMTGFLNKNEFITGLTVGCLKDYGYNITFNSPYVIAYPFSLIPIESISSSASSNSYYIILY